MNNKSSVTYNIVNNGDNHFSGTMVMKILDNKVTNKKKGIGKMADLISPFNHNFNKNYENIVNETPSVFHRYNGIFSHMYDAAHRNGNLVVPFRNHNPGAPKEAKRERISKSPKTKKD